MIRLRFVSYNTITSEAISLYEGSKWDHVEAVMPDGSGYLGAVDDSKGVAIRPVGYDTPFTRELFVDLPADDVTSERFYWLGRQFIGTPYDAKAILGFALHADLHQKGHAICSAAMTILLVKSAFFPAPLTWKPHQVDPDVLLLILSGRVPIKAE